MARCLYCGAALAAAQPHPERKCPVCPRPLAPVTCGWVVIDKCGRCGGEFYDVGELERVERLTDDEAKWLRETAGLPRPPGQGGPRKCPGCAHAMEAITEAYEVTIDVCPHCRGVWCDKGEADLLRAKAREHHERGATMADVSLEGERVARFSNLVTDVVFDAIDGGTRARDRMRRGS